MKAILVLCLLVLLPVGVRAQVDEDEDETDKQILSLLRARFVGGVVLSNTGQRLNIPIQATVTTPEQFTKANVYLAFESQPEVIKDRKLQLDPLFNVRLTTIGVTSGATAEAIQLQGNTVAGFVQSEKAAVIQGGLLASFAFHETTWKIANQAKKFRWQLGPVIKGGYQSVTGAQQAIRIWDRDDDLFDFYSGGLRLALMAKDIDRNRWMPTAYIEGGWGSFENFEQAEPISDRAKMCLTSLEAFTECVANPPPSSDFRTKERKRNYLEGRLYLSAFHVGFEINNGSGVDDMRFFAGVAFDPSKFLKSGTTKQNAEKSGDKQKK